MNIHKFCIRFVLLLGFLLLINQEASSKISSFSTERSEVRLKTYKNKNKNVRKSFRQNINNRKIRVVLTILILGVGSVGVKLMQIGFSSVFGTGGSSGWLILIGLGLLVLAVVGFIILYYDVFKRTR